MNNILNNIKNIIFDLGEVIVPVDTTKTIAAFDKISKSPTDQYYSYLGQIELFSKLETGKMSPDEFRVEIRKLMKSEVSGAEIDKAWCAMMHDIPKSKLDILLQLKSQYRTFVLSNTNAIHIAWIDAFMKEHYDEPGLEPFFDHAYYSHVIGFRKPDANAYDVVTTSNNLEPSQTLFIDDREENIVAANQLGLQTFHMTNPDQFFELFKNEAGVD